MDVPTQVEPFFSWLLMDTGDGQSAVLHFVLTALALLGIASVAAYLVAAFRHGPIQGAKVVLRSLGDGLIDILRISPRRVYGLATLAFREAFRRYIWVALVMFLIMLAFTGWFLDPKSGDPAKLYLTWVITPTTYLMLAIALYLSSLSLPADIKNRTIYTVVTKPVRPSEIILGRICGFTAACTVLLAVMGVAGYLFVIRAVSHTHQLVVEDDGTPVRPSASFAGYTTRATGGGHHHMVRIPANSFSPGVELTEGSDGTLIVTQKTDAARKAGIEKGDVVSAIDGESTTGKTLEEVNKALDGAAGSKVRLTLSRGGAPRDATLERLTAQTMTEITQGHAHAVVARYRDGKVDYEVGPAEGALAARIPHYGTLKFRDRQGDPKNPGTWKFKRKGISVGKLFGYRSYIQGNSLAAAIWTFEGITPENFPDGLPLDLNIRVYRLQKGNVAEGITGSLTLINPETGVRGKERIFRAKEFTLDHIDIPRELEGAQGKLDIFKDLVSSDGKLEVWLQCVEPGQSFGMARADVYIRGQDASFALNLAKAIVEIWLEILLVTSLAVMFSAFLSGPVAILVTVTAVVMGFYTSDINHLTSSVIYREELKVIEAVRQVAGQNNLDLERDGVLRLAEEWKSSDAEGADKIDIERIQKAFGTPVKDDATREYAAEWKIIQAVRQQAAADRIDLEAEGVSRMAATQRGAGVHSFQKYDKVRLDKALRAKADQVDVLDRVWGGGPCEAFYRLITQMNLTSDLEPELRAGQQPSRMVQAILAIDNTLMHVMQSLLHVLPDFRRFSDTEYLASGYNIGGSRLAQHVAATLAFSLAAFVAGFYALKYREVAA